MYNLLNPEAYELAAILTILAAVEDTARVSAII